MLHHTPPTSTTKGNVKIDLKKNQIYDDNSYDNMSILPEEHEK